MPEMRQLTLDTASQIRKGDILQQVNTKSWENTEVHVAGTKAGTTRLTILDPTGAPLTWVYLSEPVTVLRSVETEEEKAAALAARIQEEAEKIVESLQQMAASDPMADFAMQAVAGPEHATWQLKRTLEQYTDQLFISTCLKELAEQALHVAAEREADARETVAIAVGMAREGLTQGLDRFGSRSTSHFSNLLEDAQRAARARWLDSFEVRYYLAKVEREVVA